MGKGRYHETNKKFKKSCICSIWKVLNIKLYSNIKKVHLVDFLEELKRKKLNLNNYHLTILYICIVQVQQDCLNVLYKDRVLGQSYEEMILHCNIKRDDKVFYYTTTGWMMWNWLMSALSVGATVVVWEGNPCYPEWDSLWKMAEETELTLFGTSAAYLQAIMNAGCEPGKKFNLSNLRTIASTGSPATDVVFNYVYTKIKPDVQFASISGGTDLNDVSHLDVQYYLSTWANCNVEIAIIIYDDDGRSIVNKKRIVVKTISIRTSLLE